MTLFQKAVLASAVTAWALASTLPQANAQSQPKKPQPAQPAPAKSTQVPVAEPVTTVILKYSPYQDDWIKLCGEDKNLKANWCLTTRDFVSDQNAPVASMIVYDIQGEANKTMRFLLPLSLMIQPGARLSIDEGQSQPTKYMLCAPEGCYSEIKVKDDTILALKSGKNLNISVRNQFDKEIVLQIPLGNFGKIYDGKPIDTAVFEAQQKKMQEEMQRQAEEMRKKMGQQGQAPAQGQAAPAQGQQQQAPAQ